mgnify:CR=1 FL=1
MTEEPSDRALCESIELQATLLGDAYGTGDTTAIDHALIRVADARTMMKNRLYELMYGDGSASLANAAPPTAT